MLPIKSTMHGEWTSRATRLRNNQQRRGMSAAAPTLLRRPAKASQQHNAAAQLPPLSCPTAMWASHTQPSTPYKQHSMSAAAALSTPPCVSMTMMTITESRALQQPLPPWTIQILPTVSLGMAGEGRCLTAGIGVDDGDDKVVTSSSPSSCHRHCPPANLSPHIFSFAA